MNQSLFRNVFYKLEDFRLRLHFAYVLQKLNEDILPSPQNSEEQTRRLALIKRLRQYKKNNRFPRNSNGGKPKPYFFDAELRPCAVADLLNYTGKKRLAKEIAEWDNNAKVKDMHFPELLYWAQKNAVSQQDLILIQPQYIEVSLQGLPILILSCANLLFLIMYGKRHIKYTLFAFGIALVLIFAVVKAHY